MEEQRYINLKEEHQDSREEENKVNNKKGRKLYSIVILVLIIFVSFHVLATPTGSDNESMIDRIPVIGQIKHLAESSSKELKGEDEDRINILLLGMGGSEHEGGYLADTIMVASIRPSTKEASMISIPRDMAVPIEGENGWQKINSVNSYAEMEERGSGGLAMSQTLEGILDVPIHYYARIDFEGFVNIIDELGGIEVYVEETLDDYRYPVRGMEDAENYESRYEHLHVDEGWQEMNGSLALKYARSRHAAGAQGSDFARARRQQNVIEAAKEKFKSSNILMKPSIISGILKELKDHISTDMEIWEMIKLYEIGKDMNTENIEHKVLSNAPNGLLRSHIATSTGYILYPRGGDFNEIKYLVKNIFQKEKTKDMNSKFSDVKLEIRNGTWINGLAGKTSIELELDGFKVIRIGNSHQKNFQKTVIYDLNFGENTEALKSLKQKFNANVSFSIPDWLQEDIKRDVTNESNPETPNFIIILGQNANK